MLPHPDSHIPSDNVHVCVLCLPRIMYGFISCLKDGMVGLCGEDYFELLEATYEEVFIEVIGDAFGCNEENEPLFGEYNPFIMMRQNLSSGFPTKRDLNQSTQL